MCLPYNGFREQTFLGKVKSYELAAAMSQLKPLAKRQTHACAFNRLSKMRGIAAFNRHHPVTDMIPMGVVTATAPRVNMAFVLSKPTFATWLVIAVEQR